MAKLAFLYSDTDQYDLVRLSADRRPTLHKQTKYGKDLIAMAVALAISLKYIHNHNNELKTIEQSQYA